MRSCSTWMSRAWPTSSASGSAVSPDSPGRLLVAGAAFSGSLTGAAGMDAGRLKLSWLGSESGIVKSGCPGASGAQPVSSGVSWSVRSASLPVTQSRTSPSLLVPALVFAHSSQSAASGSKGWKVGCSVASAAAPKAPCSTAPQTSSCHVAHVPSSSGARSPGSLAATVLPAPNAAWAMARKTGAAPGSRWEATAARSGSTEPSGRSAAIAGGSQYPSTSGRCGGDSPSRSTPRSWNAKRRGLLGEGRELCADAIELHERDEGVGQRIQPGFQRAAHVLQVGPELGGLAPLACAADRRHLGLLFQLFHLLLQAPHGGVGMLPEPECLTHLRNTATARGHPWSLPGARHRGRGFPPPGPAVPLTARDGRLHDASRRLAGWGHVPHVCA